MLAVLLDHGKATRRAMRWMSEVAVRDGNDVQQLLQFCALVVECLVNNQALVTGFAIRVEVV